MDFLVNIENVNSPSQIPSKLIDYAIAGRPILSINPVITDQKVIEQFLNKDYSNQYRVQDVEQYQISNVVEKFTQLIHEKTK